MKADALAERCRRLRLLMTDVDGVLTDGSLYVFSDGGDGRAFHIRDGLATVLARRAGLRVGLLSGRSSAAVAKRAAELGIDIVLQGVGDKAAAIRDLLARLSLTPAEVAFVGDDLNDLPAFAEVGLTAAPADAAFQVRSQALLLLETTGGHGCLRELVEIVLRARGDWESVAASVAGVPVP
jgi:3-deoxy-D-manno-octulosonate 8-phosphate phosphatase (KDO 8-P phosphatase)